jgi:hypothetical protein
MFFPLAGASSTPDAQTNANAKEAVMANREQKGNREKRKPKKEKPKGAPVVSSFGAPPKPSSKGK